MRKCKDYKYTIIANDKKVKIETAQMLNGLLVSKSVRQTKSLTFLIEYYQLNVLIDLIFFIQLQKYIYNNVNRCAATLR